MIQKLLSRIRRIVLPSDRPTPSPEWQALAERMEQAKRVIDLGCGASPHPRASVGVDAFLDPRQRALGHGPKIDPGQLTSDGFHFVRADLTALPFADKSFDFVYSHHVFEHLPDPKRACAEAARIGVAGAVITPSPFSETAFGRSYHLWLVFSRGNTLFFLRKRAGEDCPFGEHPEFINGRWRATGKTNPFDILLNDGHWYRGPQRMPRLARLIRRHWKSHSPVTETVFLWEGNLECVVIREDGSIE